MSYLIDLQALKHYSFIEGDVNDEMLTVILKRVQDRYIEPIIGTPLYKKLLDDIENDTLAGNYVTLMNYIINVVVVGCEIKATTHQNFKIRNKFVGIAEDDNGRANSVNEGNNLIDELKADFSHYRNKLVGYLKDNYTLFPEWKCTDKHEDFNPEKNKGTNYTDRISFI